MEIIVFFIPDSKLFLKVFKGEEPVVSVEILVILAVAALHIAVVPGRIGTDELVLDP